MRRLPCLGYELCDGTSMAAPHVAGLAGLISSYYAGLTPTQLRAMIMRYVDTLPALQGVIKSGGRINAYKAISSLLTPSGLSANALSSTQTVLTWNDNATGEDGYKIERKTLGGGFAEIAETGAKATTVTDSGLNPSTEYTYRVRAFNSIPVASLYSNEVSVTTFSAPSPTPTPTPASGGGGGGCSVGKRTLWLRWCGHPAGFVADSCNLGVSERQAKERIVFPASRFLIYNQTLAYIKNVWMES